MKRNVALEPGKAMIEKLSRISKKGALTQSDLFKTKAFATHGLALKEEK